MLIQKSIQLVKRNRITIMFILAMILLIILACWIADQLIEHIDKNLKSL